MNKNERAKLIRAMEFIAAQINDEEICLGWRAAAVADAGIEYGDLSNNPEGVEPYIDDESFADVMDTFLWCCKDAWASGGLFCDGVRSGPKEPMEDGGPL